PHGPSDQEGQRDHAHDDRGGQGMEDRELEEEPEDDVDEEAAARVAAASSATTTAAAEAVRAASGGSDRLRSQGENRQGDESEDQEPASHGLAWSGVAGAAALAASRDAAATGPTPACACGTCWSAWYELLTRGPAATCSNPRP